MQTYARCMHRWAFFSFLASFSHYHHAIPRSSRWHFRIPHTALFRQIQSDLTDAALNIPEYYYAPIHAYADGNLCWDSAMEVCRAAVRSATTVGASFFCLALFHALRGVLFSCNVYRISEHVVRCRLCRCC